MSEEIFAVGDRETRVHFTSNLPELSATGKRLYVFDEGTAALFQNRPPNALVLTQGEGAKDWASVEKILQRAFSLEMARDSCFIGVGGGMVCDITAFAASLFMRGAGLELIPTSLLAMVDAAFGGKTAVNFEGKKNQLGTFYPAEKITVSSALLASLPEREYLSGLAEVLKSAMLGDWDLFSLLARHGKNLLSPASRRDKELNLELSRRSLLVKARFVSQDPTEKGIRAHLNLGHTFAHGLEAATDFSRFTHGEAVAWGLLRALDAGLRQGLTDRAYAEETEGLVRALGYPSKVRDVNPKLILAAMQGDKKKKDGQIHFVLQHGPEDTLTMPLDDAFVEKVVASGVEP